MPLYFIEQLFSVLLLFPLLSGNHCVTLLQMVTAKSQAQVFWPPPKGRLRKRCRLGTRLARHPLQPAGVGGLLRRPREGVPHSPLEPAMEPAETLLAFPPRLAQRLWFWWNATGSSFSGKKNRFGAQRPPSEGGLTCLLLLIGTQTDASWTQVTSLTVSCSGKREPASPSSLEEIKALLRAFPPCFWRKGKSKELARKRER